MPIPRRGIDLEAEPAAFEQAIERADPRVDASALDAGDRLLRDPGLGGELALGQLRPAPRVSKHASGHRHRRPPDDVSIIRRQSSRQASSDGQRDERAERRRDRHEQRQPVVDLDLAGRDPLRCRPARRTRRRSPGRRTRSGTRPVNGWPLRTAKSVVLIAASRAASWSGGTVPEVVRRLGRRVDPSVALEETVDPHGAAKHSPPRVSTVTQRAGRDRDRDRAVGTGRPRRRRRAIASDATARSAATVDRAWPPDDRRRLPVPVARDYPRGHARPAQPARPERARRRARTTTRWPPSSPTSAPARQPSPGAAPAATTARSSAIASAASSRSASASSGSSTPAPPSSS